MPYKLVTRGKNKGKYRSPRGRIRTLKSIRAEHARKKNK